MNVTYTLTAIWSPRNRAAWLTPAAAEHLVIGGKDPAGNTFGNYFTGELYNVHIFNYALTQSNIIAAIGPLPPTIEIQPPTNVTAYATFQTQISPGAVSAACLCRISGSLTAQYFGQCLFHWQHLEHPDHQCELDHRGCV